MRLGISRSHPFLVELKVTCIIDGDGDGDGIGIQVLGMGHIRGGKERDGDM